MTKDKRDLTKRINDYFDNEIRITQENSKWYSSKAQESPYQTEKKHFEDKAWFSGINRPAQIDDTRRDILRLL